VTGIVASDKEPGVDGLAGVAHKSNLKISRTPHKARRSSCPFRGRAVDQLEDMACAEALRGVQN